MKDGKTDLIKKPDLPSIRARAEEMESIFALFAIYQELETAEKRMMKRIKAIPYGLRDLHLIRSLVDKFCTNLIGTLPAEKYDNVSANARHMTYDIHFNKYSTVARDSNYALVRGDDLEVLMSRTHDYFCSGCDKRCGQCEIGKAFDHIMIQSRRKNESWEFIDMHADHAGGELVEKDFE